MVKYEVEFESTGEISEYPTLSDAIQYVYHTAHSFGQMPLIEVRARVENNEEIPIYEHYNPRRAFIQNGRITTLTDGCIRKVK